jgi:hypothetical protein
LNLATFQLITHIKNNEEWRDVTFEVLTAMKMSMFFWTVTSRKFVGRNQRFGGTQYLSPEDGGSIFLRNVGISLQVDMALQPKDQHQ